MQTELITTTRSHYKKLPDGTYVEDSTEEVTIERPIGPVMTPEERIKQLEDKIEQLLANV